MRVYFNLVHPAIEDVHGVDVGADERLLLGRPATRPQEAPDTLEASHEIRLILSRRGSRGR